MRLAIKVECTLAGMMDTPIRTLSSRLLSEVKDGVDRLCQGAAQSYYVRIETEFLQYYPETINTKAETEFCEAVLRSTFGDARVHADFEPNMTSEDFGFMLEARPGTYVLAGGGGEAGLHNPGYDFNDELIPQVFGTGPRWHSPAFSDRPSRFD